VTGAGAGIAEGLRDAFATADLRRLLVGSAAASVGGWAFMVGLSVYAYQAGGAAAVGLAALVRMLPAGFAAPLAGAVADRRSRRDLLVASCAGRGLALAAIAVAVAAGAPLGVVLALAAGVTILQTAQRPAQAALLALLARTPRELGAANAAWSSLDSAGFVVGALLGGALIAATATTVVLAATAAAFAVASLALERIARDPVPADPRGRARAPAPRPARRRARVRRGPGGQLAARDRRASRPPRRGLRCSSSSGSATRSSRSRW
jgi:MFS family permease